MDRQRLALLALSAILAIAYGAFGSSLYQGAPPYVVGTIFKVSSIVVLALIALTAGAGKLERAAPAAHAAQSAALPPSNKLLAAGLLFGALGDALLAWSPSTFLYGALAFLIGHLFYITLFVRSGIGVRAALLKPLRAMLMFVMVAAAITNTTMLIPNESPMFAPFAVYAAVLTLMVITAYTLPRARWLATAGAVLFFVSDGFVALNMFHRNPDPTAAYWLSFAGWLIYWAGQAAICAGMLAKTTPK